MKILTAPNLKHLCRCAVLTVSGLVAIAPPVSAQTASEGLALCLMQGVDPGRTMEVISAGYFPQVQKHIRSNNLNVTYRWEGDVGAFENFREFTTTFEWVRKSEAKYPNLSTYAVAGVALFDKNIRDRGNGGVYGEALAAHSSKPEAYRCEIIKSFKICTAGETGPFFLPCDL